MLTRIDDKWVSGRYTRFLDRGKLIKGGKSNLFSVSNKNGLKIGQIKWFNHFRCYCFYPDSETTFDKECLREIAEFCEGITKAHISKQRFLALPEVQVVEGSDAPKDKED